jgi:hypothetical protein
VAILLLALPGNDPRMGSHVGDAVGVAGDERAAVRARGDACCRSI